LVAGRLGPLRRFDDPHGLALGRYLPHCRRARRRRHRLRQELLQRIGAGFFI